MAVKYFEKLFHENTQVSVLHNMTPWYAEFSYKNVKMCLHFLPFLSIETEQVLEISRHVREVPI